jgi:hypothetical protein
MNDTATVTVTTYVEYLYPGIVMSETSARPVTGRDPARAAREAPDGVFAFRFFDKASVTADVGGEGVLLDSRPIRESGRYYIDAEKLSAEDVAALPGDHKILLSNMHSNGWAFVLRCCTGNFQPFNDGDSIVTVTPRAEAGS